MTLRPPGALACFLALSLGPAHPGVALADDAKPGEVTLDAAMVQRGDIAFAVLGNGHQKAEVAAYGRVLDPAPLAEAMSAEAAALAARDAATARLSASQESYTRARRLYTAEQNISKAELQTAEAGYRGDQAALSAAEAGYTAAATALRGAWGSALIGNAALVEQVLAGKSVLIQATVPSGSTMPPVSGLAGQGQIALAYVSPAPRVDQHMPGASFLMTAPASATLPPGASIVLDLQSSAEVTGAVVPESAVVRWQAADWIYVETDAHTVTRRRIPTDWPTRAVPGYLVSGLPEDSRVVIKGTQLVLSEEFKALGRAGDND